MYFSAERNHLPGHKTGKHPLGRGRTHRAHRFRPLKVNADWIFPNHFLNMQISGSSSRTRPNTVPSPSAAPSSTWRQRSWEVHNSIGIHFWHVAL